MIEKESLTHRIEDDMERRNRNWDIINAHIRNYTEQVGNPANLTTVSKEVVGAVNELKDEIDTNKEELTQHKLDYTEQRQQDQLKVAKVEKELNDYKKVMSQVNVNQEAKQSTSGYGTISLPPNAANGQVSVTIKGLTAINLLGTNGDFASGTDKLAKGWEISKPYLSHAYDGIEKSQSFSILYHDNYLYYNLNINNGHKYYIRFLLKKTIEKESKLLIGFENTIGELIKNNTTITNDMYNTETYTEINKILLPTADYSFIGFSGFGGISCNAKIKDMTLVDLTELFGAGNEPTIDECKQIFNGHISGTKSTISAMRITSENEDKTEKSQAYVVAKKDNKIVNLRSLPNGTKDEIRVSGGKAELVQRVSDEYIIPPNPTLEIRFNGENNVGYSINIPNFQGLPMDRRIEFRNNHIKEVPFADRDLIENRGNFYTSDYIPEGLVFIFEKGLTSEQRKEQIAGLELIYQLAEPEIIPVEVSGNIVSNPNGTIYIEPAVADANVYNDGIAIFEQELNIDYIDKIAKVDYVTGVEIPLDASKAVISEDKKSFTHPDLMNGDMVFFSYFYSNESTQGEATVEYYDSRYVIKDKSLDKFYQWDIEVDNGVPSIKVVEV